MKFSFRQILASTAGAVIAAIIASTFGVKGTIVGVAIGSAAATIGTAFVAQSIERGHEAVKQVVVKAPDTALLLRRLGGTGASGDTRGSASSAPTQVMGRTSPSPSPSLTDDVHPETVEMASSAAPAGETERLEISAVTDAPATERLQATTRPLPPATPRPTAVARRFSWQTIAVSAVIVFVLALLLITAIELISGKPLSAIFGGSDTGTSVNNLINPPPAPSTTTSTTSTSSTTSTTGGATSTTTSSTAPTTTSSTAPAGESTTTTSPGPSLTTTTVGGGGGVSSTTTTAAP